jgi:putative flippase GtrA
VFVKTQLIGQFMRFALVGALASTAYALIAAALTYAEWVTPMVASVATYSALIPVAYLMQKRFAFRAAGTMPRSFMAYAVTQLGIMAAVSALTTRLVTADVLTNAIVFFGTAGLAALASFLICNFGIFKRQVSVAQ